MSRKDFIALAADLRIEWRNLADDKQAQVGFKLALDCIITACIRANPRFDVDKFCDAVFKA